MSHVVLPGPLRERVNADLSANAKLRDRSPENLQQFVAEALTAEQKKPRVDTIHSWKTGQSFSAGQDQYANQEVTFGKPTGAILQVSGSATGADAESWGSIPPALFQSTESDTEPLAEPVRRRYKLSP